MEPFAVRLQRLRLDRGYTLAGLARAVEVSEGTIRQLESGTTKSPSFHVGLRIASALGVDPFVLGFGASASKLDDEKRRNR